MINENEKNEYLLNDKVVKKLFTSSKVGNELMLTITSLITGISLENLKRDFELIHPDIGVNKNIINSEADVAFENQEGIFSFEFNYTPYRGLTEKSMSYVCQFYLRQINHKEDYKKLKKVYSINVNNFDYFKLNRFVYISEMRERKSGLSRNVGIYYIDINLDYLRKIGYDKDNKSCLEKILYMFVCNDLDELKEIYKGDELMSKVIKEAEEIVKDFDLLMYYDKKKLDEECSYYNGQVDGFNFGVEKGIDCGLEKGFNIGEQQKTKELAKKMLDKKADISFIQEITGLSEKEIKELEESKIIPFTGLSKEKIKELDKSDITTFVEESKNELKKQIGEEISKSTTLSEEEKDWLKEKHDL